MVFTHLFLLDHSWYHLSTNLEPILHQHCAPLRFTFHNTNDDRITKNAANFWTPLISQTDSHSHHTSSSSRLFFTQNFKLFARACSFLFVIVFYTVCMHSIGCIPTNWPVFSTSPPSSANYSSLKLCTPSSAATNSLAHGYPILLCLKNRLPPQQNSDGFHLLLATATAANPISSLSVSINIFGQLHHGGIWKLYISAEEMETETSFSFVHILINVKYLLFYRNKCLLRCKSTYHALVIVKFIIKTLLKKILILARIH